MRSAETGFGTKAACAIAFLTVSLAFLGMGGAAGAATHFAPLRSQGHSLQGGAGFGTTSVSSTNWAGYAVVGPNGSVTDVKGSWTVPTFKGSCGGLYNFSEAAFWVGIDGYSSNTVEQIGTSIECTSVLYFGSVTYFAWYEFYPASPVTISLTVSPGDHVSAEVKYSASSGSYTLSLKDTTSGKSFSTSSSTVTASRSSAEWIAEAPSGFSGVLPLVDFGSVHFARCAATVSGSTHPIGGFSNYQVTMVNGAGTANKAVPGSLNLAGNAFVVAWKSYGP